MGTEEFRLQFRSLMQLWRATCMLDVAGYFDYYPVRVAGGIGLMVQYDEEEIDRRIAVLKRAGAWWDLQWFRKVWDVERYHAERRKAQGGAST